ncbi:MAG: FMN-binding protein [Candidatus Izemoplasmatales bacterium]
MIVFLLAILLGVTGVVLGKYIRKGLFYLITLSLILSAIPLFKIIPIFEEYIVSGYIGLAFYVVVMFAGAFTQGSKLSKKLKAVRKEYSILGFIFLLPHFYIYLSAYLRGSLAWEFFGVAAFLIMIPLFITSFSIIKKNIPTKKWFQLQKAAYFVYLLIFIHLVLVAQVDHQLAYAVIFGLYTVMKLNVSLLKTKKALKYVVSSAVLVVVGVFFYTSLTITGEDSITGSVLDNTIATTTSGEDPAEDVILTGDNLGPFAVSDGSYTGYSTAYKGATVEVVVTVVGGYITNISILQDGASEPERGVDFEAAAITVANSIFSEQQFDVDTVAGATETSDGIIDAVMNALGY